LHAIERTVYDPLGGGLLAVSHHRVHELGDDEVTELGIRVDFALLGTVTTRSEEHTSELQSRENLVCRLLLEKKNGICKTSNKNRRRFHVNCDRPNIATIVFEIFVGFPYTPGGGITYSSPILQFVFVHGRRDS